MTQQKHVQHFFRRAVLIGVVAMVGLVGCTRVQTPAPTITAPPTVNIPSLTGEDCPRPALENYLQRATALVQEFADTAGAGVNLPPAAITIITDRIAAIQGTVQILQPPACAKTHHEMFLLILERAFLTYDEYGKGNVPTLENFVVEINAALESIRGREAELNAIYERLPN